MKRFTLVEGLWGNSQNKQNNQNNQLWRYLACLFLLLCLGVGNVWGETLSVSITSPDNNSITQNNITVTHSSRQSKTFNGVASTTVYKVDGSNPISITSTTQNITKLVFEACYSSSGTSLASSCKVSVSDDGSTYYPLTSMVNVAGGTGTTATSTSGIYISGYGGKTEVTVTFHSAYRYIKIEKDGKETWVNVVKVYTESNQTITWNNGGHSTAPTSPTSAAGLVMPKLHTTEYVHVGWKANATTRVNGVATDANILIPIGAAIQLTAATTLTAQWEEADCSGLIFSMFMNDMTATKSLAGSETVDMSNYAEISRGSEVQLTNTSGSAYGAVTKQSDAGRSGWVTLNNDAVYLKLDLCCALQTGDVLSFTSGTDANTTYEVYITSSTTRGNTYATSSNSWTVPAAFNGVSTIYLWKGSSTATIRTIAIIRPGSSPSTSADDAGASGTITFEDWKSLSTATNYWKDGIKFYQYSGTTGVSLSHDYFLIATTVPSYYAGLRSGKNWGSYNLSGLETYAQHALGISVTTPSQIEIILSNNKKDDANLTTLFIKKDNVDYETGYAGGTYAGGTDIKSDASITCLESGNGRYKITLDVDATDLASSNPYIVKLGASGSSAPALFCYESVTVTPIPTCTAPDHVEITPTEEDGNYGWRYSTGETLKLTATPYDDGDDEITSGITGYQWQKYVGSTWTDLEDDTYISGATTANLQISNLTTSNGGSYRCNISTGATCTTSSDGYFVRIFTLYGGYSGGSYSHQPIVWTGEKEGTVTVNLNASSTYKFKFTDNDGKWYGNGGTISKDLASNWDWGFGTSAGDATLSTGSYGGGDYVLTVDITHFDDGGSKYVNLRSVVYPKKTTYLQLCSDWKAATAKYAAYYWNGGSNGWTDFMETFGCDGDIRYADIPVWATNAFFVRFNPDKSSTGNYEYEWNRSGDNESTLPTDGKDYYNSLSVGGNGKYYGSWGTFSPTTYTISFANGGGSGSMSSISSISCDADQALTANSFEKTGYDFSCWHADVDVTVDDATVSSGSDIADEATIQNIRSDIALTAQWTAKTTSVTLDPNTANHGTGSSVVVTATYDAALPSFDAAVPDAGYTLKGYYTDKTGGTKVIDADGTFSSNSGTWNRTDGATLTLYAQYEDASYSVSITPTNVSKTSGATGSSAATHGTNYVAVFARTTGYDLPSTITVTIGGNSTTSGTEYTWNQGTGTVTINGSYITGNIAITVTGTLASHTLAWNFDGGSTSATEGDDYTAGGSVSYGSSLTYPANNTMSKTGYDFAGWSSSPSTMPDNDLTITATWTAHTYTVNLDHQDGTCEKDTLRATYNATLPSSERFDTPTRDAYTFNGYYTQPGAKGDVRLITQSCKWNSSAKEGYLGASRLWVYTGADPLTLYARWDQSVILDDNGGSADGSVTLVWNRNSRSGDVSAPTYEGHTVDLGYFAEAACTNKVLDANGSLQTSVTVNTVPYTDASRKWVKEGETRLYAHWKCNTPEISCTKNVVTITVPSGATVYYTTDGSTPTSSSTAYNPSSKPVIAEDVVIRAIAIQSGCTSSDVATKDCEYDSGIVYLPGTLDKSNVSTVSEDMGWYGSSEEYFDYGSDDLENIGRWAEWQVYIGPGTYSVSVLGTYIQNGHSWRISLINGSGSTVSSCTTDDNWHNGSDTWEDVISSWSLSSISAGEYTIRVENAMGWARPKLLSLTFTGDGTLYTVTYNANGGTCGTSSATQRAYGAPVKLPTPTKIGYSCTGWWTNSSSGTKRGDARDTYTPEDDETLYAQWECATPSFDTDLSTSEVEYIVGDTPSDLEVKASANEGTITYQWYSNDENNYTTPTKLTGQTSASLTPSTAAEGTIYYFCEAKNTTGGNCTANSSITPVAIGPDCSTPAAPTISGTTAYTYGGTITLIASHDGDNHDGSTTYTWYKGASYAGASQVQAAATGSSGYTFTKTAALDDAGTYWCKASNGTGCSANNSVGYAITVGKASISPSLSYSSASLITGDDSSSPTLTGNTGSGTVTYSSSDTDVASVDSSTGVVTAVAEGTARITASIAATDNYLAGSAYVDFTVTDPCFEFAKGSTKSSEPSKGTSITTANWSSDDAILSGGTMTNTSANTLGINNSYGLVFAAEGNREVTVTLASGNAFVEGTKIIISGYSNNSTDACGYKVSGNSMDEGTFTPASESYTAFTRTYTVTTDDGIEGETSFTIKAANSIRVYVSGIKVAYCGTITGYTVTATATTNMTGTFTGSDDITNSPVVGIESGTSVSSSDNTFIIGETTVTAPTTIAGKVTVDDGGEPYDASCTWRFKQWNNLPATVTADVDDVEAEYIPTFAINYNTNGGTINAGQVNWYEYTGSSSDEVTLPTNVTKTGYTFVKWMQDCSAWSGADVERSVITCNFYGTFSLYAVWTEDTHSVSVAAGAHGSVSTSSVSGVGIATASSEITATPATGYSFNGWTLPSGVTAAATYSASSNPIKINATADSKTITATWTTVSYTITYNLNSGSLDGSQKTSYNIETEDYDLPTPTYSGHVFQGWYTDEDFTSDRVYTLAEGSTGDKTYYAKWGAEVSVAWTVTKVDGKLYKGGGGYFVTAIVDDASWTGSASSLVLGASDGVLLGTTTTSTVDSKAQIVADFDITEDVEGDDITFTLTGPENGSYAAIEDHENVDLDACPSGGSTPIVWDFTTNDFLNSGSWSNSSGTVNNAYATDGTTILKYTAGGSGDAWDSSNKQLTTKGKTGTSSGSSKLQLTSCFFQFPTLSGKAKITITYGGTANELKVFEAESDNIYGLTPIITFTSSSTESSSYTFNSSKKYYMTMPDNKSYFKNITWTPIGSSGIATSLSWSGSLADGATVNKNDVDADFTYSASVDVNSIGAITYVSSAPTVATVNASGKVHIVGDGETTIKAILAACGCFNADTISYTLNVANTCDDVAGTIVDEDGNAIAGNAISRGACEALTLKLTGHTGSTIAWKKDGVTIVGATNATYAVPTGESGVYSATVTGACTLSSTNSITVTTAGSVDPTIFADEFTVKQGHWFGYRLMEINNGESVSVKTAPTGWVNLSDFKITTKDNIVSIEGNVNRSTGDKTLTLTIANECGGSTDKAFTIHEIAETAKPTVAWIATGDNKGADYLAAVKASESTNTALYKYLEDYYTITPRNGYWSVSEADLVKEYSKYDLIILTDYPNSKTGPSGKGASKSYTNAIGQLIDHKPILTFEAFVAGCPNWGIATDPSNTEDTQTDLTLLCNASDIFNDKTGKFAAGEAIPVTTASSGQALQGFPIASTPDFVFIGMITDDAKQYVACCERQVETAARMMVFGLNSNLMDNLTDDGKAMVKGFIDYLMKTDPADIPDCSVIFTGDGADESWYTTGNWEGGSLPNEYASVRIDKPCVVPYSTDPAMAGYIKIHTDEASGTYTGSLTIEPKGRMIVDKKITRVDGNNYTKHLATRTSDLVLETSVDGNGVLIMGSYDGTNKATVGFYTKAKKTGGHNVNQFIGTPFNDENYIFNNYYGTKIYEFRADGSGDKGDANEWIRLPNDGDMRPFYGYNILTNNSETRTLWMEGTLVASKDQTMKMYYNGSSNTENMFANSWPAPIEIRQFKTSDFGGGVATVYIFNAGTRENYTAMGDGSASATSAGQYIVLPIASAPWTSPTVRVIPSMQAFSVFASGSNQTLTLDYDRLVRTRAKVMDKDSITTATRAPRYAPEVEPVVMHLRVDGLNGYATNMHMLERADLTDGFDNGWDGHHLVGDEDAPQLYAITEAGKMNVNCVPNMEGTVLGFRAGVDNQFTFSFGYEGEEDWYLNDLKNQTSTLIDPLSSYTFMAEQEDTEARFVISRTPIQQTPTGIETDTSGNNSIVVRKLIINDKVYIIRGGRMYSIDGALVVPMMEQK